MLQDTINEVKQIIQELKDEETKITSLSLVKIPELVKETISNLEEDQQEIQEKHDELLAYNEEL